MNEPERTYSEKETKKWFAHGIHIGLITGFVLGATAILSLDSCSSHLPDACRPEKIQKSGNAALPPDFIR